MFVRNSLFYKIDVTLKRQLRKLHVSTGTAAVFIRIIHKWITRQLATYESHSYSHTVNVIPVVSIPYLPRIRNKE